MKFCCRSPCMCICHHSFTCVTWLVYVCDRRIRCIDSCDMTPCACLWSSAVKVPACVCVMIYSRVCHVSYVRGMMHWYLWHDSVRFWMRFCCRRPCMCVCQDLFTCVPCLIYVCDMTHWYLWRDSNSTYLWSSAVEDPVYVCAMTPSFLCHESFTYATRLISNIQDNYRWVMTRQLQMSHVKTITDESCH